jgi:transposase
MKAEKSPEQSAAEGITAAEGSGPKANAQGPAVGPSGTEGASVALPQQQDAAPPRLHVPDRQQLISSKTIDELLEEDHPARSVWSYVEGLDLTPLYDQIRARGSVAGRPATDPRLLVALWLYATLSGFTSARELADLCVRHDAFRWLCGGVSVNYHSLADFRTDNLVFLEKLLKQSVELLRQQGLIDLDRVAQDGMRVRASAGAASFRRRQTLERLLREAQDEIERLKEQLAASDAEATTPQEVASEESPAEQLPSPQQQAAAMRHAEERVERIEQAMERLPEMEAKIKPGEDKEARVSTTDPEASVMKMADGGYRPAYNVEYSTACQGQAIVGVDVITVGSDMGQLPPMLDQIENRFEQYPKEALVDGRVASLKDIEEVQGGKKKCVVYAPVSNPK